MLLASLLVLATLASSGCSVRLLDSLTQNRKSEDEVIESVENCYYQYRDEIERFAKFLYSQDNIKRLCIYSPRRGADYCDARTDTLVQLKEDILPSAKALIYPMKIWNCCKVLRHVCWQTISDLLISLTISYLSDSSNSQSVAITLYSLTRTKRSGSQRT